MNPVLPLISLHPSIQWLRRFERLMMGAFLCAVLLLLGACAGGGQVRERDYFPGNSPYYNLGISQSKENFANVKRAEVSEGFYQNKRNWGWFEAGRALGTVGMLTYYLPLSFRWELKDGRQFIIEDIDVRAIMKEYFKDKSNDITLPWQREGRQQTNGDYDPSLTYEVVNDSIRLKWLIAVNMTPVNMRRLPSGATAPLKLTYEEYLVTEIKGKPVQGLDFVR